MVHFHTAYSWMDNLFKLFGKINFSDDKVIPWNVLSWTESLCFKVFFCAPHSRISTCIHPYFQCFAVKDGSRGRNLSTHVLLPLCRTQQMLCAGLQQMDVLSSEDMCFSYGPFYSLCLFSLYFNRYTNKEIIHAVQFFTLKRWKCHEK